MKFNKNFKIHLNKPELDVIKLLDFKDYPILTLEKDKIGNIYLSYLIDYDEYENRAILQISIDKLNKVINVRNIFNNAENELIYISRFSIEDGETIETYLYPLDEFKKINPIPENYSINMELNFKNIIQQENDLIELSKRKNKIIFDFYLNSPNIKDNFKTWLIYKIITPIFEIIKDFLEIKQNQFDNYISFSNIRQESFGMSIEISYEKNLILNNNELEDYPEYEKIKKIIILFNSESINDFNNLLKNLKDKRSIKEYFTIINAIIKNDAILNSFLINPINEDIIKSSITVDKAKKIKTIINQNFSEIEYIENFIGSFLEIDLKTKEPSFSVFINENENIISEKIDTILLNKIKNDNISFSKNYIFKIKEINYFSEQPLIEQKTKRYLIDYNLN